MKHISTSIYTFEEMIRTNALYVDKTALLYELITRDKEYFCSRPRRFGKSLALSTLEAIFQGKRELFKGLAIDSKEYDWKVYPVLHIDFSDCGKENKADLERWLKGKILGMARRNQITLDDQLSSDDMFSLLIEELYEKKGQVVLLIDEYEKIISDHIFSPEVDGMRQVLSNFYQVVKAREAMIRFAFITGVTKYAKTSISSGMNNLNDITMHPRYATLFGYTQKELEENFSGYIDEGSKALGLERGEYLSRMKEQYDGYCFCPGFESVYNPVSVGRFFDDGGFSFRNYWISTGGNTQLIMDVARKVDLNLATDLSKPLDRGYLGTFDILSLRDKDVNSMELKSLMEQTGYLTISPRTEKGSQLIWLDFPNGEVRESFTVKLLSRQGVGREDELSLLAKQTKRSAEEGDVSAFASCIESLFAGIPHQLHLKDERYYHSAFLCFMKGLGADVEAERSVAGGRVDAVLETRKHLYVMEFKREKGAKVALKQILTKRYGDSWQFLGKQKKVHLLGINLDPKTRSVEVEEELLP